MSTMALHFLLSRVVLAASVAVPLLLSACKGGSTSEKVSPSDAPGAPGAAPPIPAEVVRVEVNDQGFQPSTVPIGTGRQLVFRRTSETTCSTEVVFPDLGIQKPLPLNTDVLVTLPASATGELTFQCGMGMYKSKVVAR